MQHISWRSINGATRFAACVLRLSIKKKRPHTSSSWYREQPYNAQFTCTKAVANRDPYLIRYGENAGYDASYRRIVVVNET
jgi:hypothetical protein